MCYTLYLIILRIICLETVYYVLLLLLKVIKSLSV